MKQFNEGLPGLVEISEDAQGRLYDKQIREYLASFLRPEQVERIEPFAVLNRLNKEMQQLSRHLYEQYDLSEGRFQLMMRLRYKGSISLGELADQLHVSPRNITGLVDHLERDGLVERVPETTDRRSIHAQLTKRGKLLVEKIQQKMVESNLDLIQDLEQEELDCFRHICVKLIQVINPGNDKRSDRG